MLIEFENSISLWCLKGLPRYTDLSETKNNHIILCSKLFYNNIIIGISVL